MKDLNKEIKIIKILYRTLSVIVFAVGLAFSCLIAIFDDAPGFVFIGTAITLAGTSFVYGLGEIIINLKKNNSLISEILKKLEKKD